MGKSSKNVRRTEFICSRVPVRADQWARKLMAKFPAELQTEALASALRAT